MGLLAEAYHRAPLQNILHVDVPPLPYLRQHKEIDADNIRAIMSAFQTFGEGGNFLAGHLLSVGRSESIVLSVSAPNDSHPMLARQIALRILPAIPFRAEEELDRFKDDIREWHDCVVLHPFKGRNQIFLLLPDDTSLSYESEIEFRNKHGKAYSRLTDFYKPEY